MPKKMLRRSARIAARNEPSATAEVNQREQTSTLDLPMGPSAGQNTYVPFVSLQCQGLVRSLCFERMRFLGSTTGLAYRDTYSWFLKLPMYQQWLGNGESLNQHSLLWIQGKPGAGKSYLMQALYMERRRERRGSSYTISFFFNAAGGDLERSISGMYRSFLVQLLQASPDLQQIFEDSPLTDRMNFDNLSVVSLRQFFEKAVIRLHPQSMVCFLDALDECDSGNDVVRDLEDLSHRLGKDFSLKICFSSRNSPCFRQHGLHLVLDAQSEHRHALASYVSKYLIGPKSRNVEIEGFLRDNANGVFAWVVLMVKLSSTSRLLEDVLLSAKPLRPHPQQIGTRLGLTRIFDAFPCIRAVRLLREYKNAQVPPTLTVMAYSSIIN
jgi:hypothetical protein